MSVTTVILLERYTEIFCILAQSFFQVYTNHWPPPMHRSSHVDLGIRFVERYLGQRKEVADGGDHRRCLQ
jgi:hypothetical protein